MEHGGVEYCCQCREYPCEKYEHIDDFDSFITHRNRRADLEKVRQFGAEAYNIEQMEKIKILDILLSGYNDGRKKTLFCVAVNLLNLQELKEALREIESGSDIEILTPKEKSAFAAGVLSEIASRRKVDLKLHRKK